MFPLFPAMLINTFPQRPSGLATPKSSETRAWRPCRLASVTTTRVMGYAKSASVQPTSRDENKWKWWSEMLDSNSDMISDFKSLFVVTILKSLFIVINL